MQGGIPGHLTRQGDNLSLCRDWRHDLPKPLRFSLGYARVVCPPHRIDRVVATHQNESVHVFVEGERKNLSDSFHFHLRFNTVCSKHDEPTFLRGIGEAMLLIGWAIGCWEEAEVLAKDFEHGLEVLRCSDYPRPCVYFEEWDDPLYFGHRVGKRSN
jgi:hypothetical protein